VKQKLETGVSLKPVLLTSSLIEVAKFARETGMQTHLAARLLPLCTFVCNSVKLQEHHLLHHVQQLGMTQLLYTPDQLQALAQAVSNPGKYKQACMLHHAVAGLHQKPQLCCSSLVMWYQVTPDAVLTIVSDCRVASLQFAGKLTF